MDGGGPESGDGHQSQMETGTLRPAMQVRMESRNRQGFESTVGAPGPLLGVSEVFAMTALEPLEKITKGGVGGGGGVMPRKTKYQCMNVD